MWQGDGRQGSCQATGLFVKFSGWISVCGILFTFKLFDFTLFLYTFIWRGRLTVRWFRPRKVRKEKWTEVREIEIEIEEVRKTWTERGRGKTTGKIIQNMKWKEKKKQEKKSQEIITTDTKEVFLKHIKPAINTHFQKSANTNTTQKRIGENGTAWARFLRMIGAGEGAGEGGGARWHSAKSGYFHPQCDVTNMQGGQVRRR